MRFVDCSSGQGATALVAALGYAGGRLPLYLDGSIGPSLALEGLSGAANGLWRRAESTSSDLALGLPRDDLGYGHSTVLWAWCKGTDFPGVWRRAKRPLPSIALKMGSSSERLLIWVMDMPVPYLKVEGANRALSYALHGPYAQCAAEKLRVPLPGTFLRAGRSRPAPVLATRLTLDQVSLGTLVADLRPAPDPNCWRER